MSNQVKRLKVGTWFRVKDYRSDDAEIIFERIKGGVLEVVSERTRSLDCWEPVTVVPKEK